MIIDYVCLFGGRYFEQRKKGRNAQQSLLLIRMKATPWCPGVTAAYLMLGW